MSRIFISYRREDSAGHAGRLFDRLGRHFGAANVFMDVSGSIEPGVDFVEAIDQAVGSCSALILVIGDEWLSCADAQGRRRLDDPDDFIRLETATALERNIRVMPVLVQGAKMPGAEDLPENLRGLARRQAIELSDTRWDFDVEKLVAALRKVLEIRPQPDGSRFKLLKIVVAGALLLLCGVWAMWMFRPQSAVKKVPEARVAEPGTRPQRQAVRPDPVLAAPERVRVPRLLGAAFGEAKRELEALDLKFGKIEREGSRRPPGTVLRQDPSAGTQLTKGSTIDLWIAAAIVSQVDYDTLQALYDGHKRVADCRTIAGIVSSIEAFVSNPNLVPAEAQSTVRYPSLKESPTIGDLATDRITRIKRARADCFRLR